MEHVTAWYWQKEVPAGLYLTLQQRKYRRRGMSVVCACISDREEQVRDLQNKMEEELQEKDIWIPGREEVLRERWTELLAVQEGKNNYAGILCVGSKVLYFSHGRMRVCGCFHRFGRTEWKTMTEACTAGEVEPGTAILVADNAFLNFCEEELRDCLRPEILETAIVQNRSESAQRRLRELAEKAERQGGKHMGAVWILPVTGGDEWNRE